MRTANYIFSVTSIILGVALILFIATQSGFPSAATDVFPWRWHIGTAIGVLLVINGAVRIWFAQDDDS
jgi:uncharacterized membrane protein